MHCFISLNKVNLDPSIPIALGITAALDLAEIHSKAIDTYVAELNDPRRALSLIC